MPRKSTKSNGSLGYLRSKRTRTEGTEINGRELNPALFLSFPNIFYCNRIGKLDGLHAKNGKKIKHKEHKIVTLLRA